MKKLVLSLLLVIVPAAVLAAGLLRVPATISTTEIFRALKPVITDAWPREGREFITKVNSFKNYYGVLLAGLPLIFLVHYVVFGPKKFPESGEKVFYYGAFLRLVHWGAALTMSLLVLSGLAVIFAKFLGGGALVLKLRAVHVGAAFSFVPFGVLLFLLLLKDMFPAPYDLKWFLVLGGYLWRRQRPVPAGKFNAGQKLWFWLGTVGGIVMFYTGYTLYQFKGPVSVLRQYLVIHLSLGLAVFGLFLVHLYMSLLAVKGALRSMISGYKDGEEVAYMHPKYYEKLKS